MDGNGRWAHQRGKPRNEGHRAGVTNVERIVQAARDSNLRYLTLYAFSVENWNRPKIEVEALMRLLESFLKKQRKQLLDKEIRLKVIGDINGMPKRVAKLLRETEEVTAGFNRWTLSLCLNYGSRSEMVSAVQAYTEAVKRGEEAPERLEWNGLAKYLYTRDLPDPDLVIRTSGEYRVSNFLLMQSAYAEYYFSPLNWPDFGPKEFHAAIESYRNRERRFGKTSEQIQTDKLSTAS